MAVILSGALGDGSSGALAVRRAGGTVLVQDPEDATVPSMPESALRAIGKADEVLPAADIGPVLARLALGVAMRDDVTVTPSGRSIEESRERPDGPPTAFACPECSGPLWEVEESGVVHYRCRVGHGYSEDAMMIEQGSTVEAALWSALEALEERAEFLRRMAGRHGAERPRMRARYTVAADDAGERTERLRAALGAASAERPHALDLHAGAAE